MIECTWCGKEQPEENFNIENRKVNGKQSWCKRCVWEDYVDRTYNGETLELRDYISDKLYGIRDRIEGYVYFVGYYYNDDKFVKIGKSIKPLKRLSQMQTGNPHELKIYHQIYTSDTYGIEKILHRIYKEHHFRGEWFVNVKLPTALNVISTSQAIRLVVDLTNLTEKLLAEGESYAYNHSTRYRRTEFEKI